MDLRDKLRSGESFTMDQRLVIVHQEMMMPAFVQYVIREQHRGGTLFKNMTDPDIGGDPLRTIRSATRPGSGFSTWMHRCLVMMRGLSVLGHLHRQRISKKDADSMLASIVDMTPADFTPLTLWKPEASETKTTHNDLEVEPIISAAITSA
jgi:hypothetical protein